jgi:hypothetical protein
MASTENRNSKVHALGQCVEIGKEKSEEPKVVEGKAQKRVERLEGRRSG